MSLHYNESRIYGPETVEYMYAAGRIAALALDEVETALVANPYRTTAELDKIADDFIRSQGGFPECVGYSGGFTGKPYAHATCISVNDVACHGVPSDYRLQEGDIVNVDLVVRYPATDGWLADTSRSFAIGSISDTDAQLLTIARNAMYVGMNMVQKGVEFKFIGAAIESYCKSKKINGKPVGIIPEFCGHGVSKTMHEPPYVEHIRNSCNIRIAPYQYFTIEPIITIGSNTRTYTMNDQWTIKTVSKARAAQFEHTMGVDAAGKLMIFTTRDSAHEEKVLQEMQSVLK